MSVMYGDSFEDRRRNRPREPWHLDKKVTLGVIIFLIAQTVSGIWYASEMVSMIRDHERRLLIAEAFEARADDNGAKISDRLGRLEERSTMVSETLKHIEGMLEAQQDRGRR